MLVAAVAAVAVVVVVVVVGQQQLWIIFERADLQPHAACMIILTVIML